MWLRDVFEPAHRAEDITSDDPELKAALDSPKYIHPRLHLLCQLVATPSGFGDDRAGMLKKAADPAWQALAASRFEPIAKRMQRYVQADDPQACRLMGQLLRFFDSNSDGVSLRIESKGFDLGACAELRPDGTCAQPRWADEWIEHVADGKAPGFVPPFRSRFGHHLVFLIDVLPEQRADDPQTVAQVREQLHPTWRANRWSAQLESLREQRAVRVLLEAEPQ